MRYLLIFLVVICVHGVNFGVIDEEDFFIRISPKEDPHLIFEGDRAVYRLYQISDNKFKQIWMIEDFYTKEYCATNDGKFFAIFNFIEKINPDTVLFRIYENGKFKFETKLKDFFDARNLKISIPGFPTTTVSHLIVVKKYGFLAYGDVHTVAEDEDVQNAIQDAIHASTEMKNSNYFFYFETLDSKLFFLSCKSGKIIYKTE